jgi:hypothetical protein
VIALLQPHGFTRGAKETPSSTHCYELRFSAMEIDALSWLIQRRIEKIVHATVTTEVRVNPVEFLR